MEEIKIVLSLMDSSEEYSFSIDRRQDPPILHIPGDHRGPDLCYPYRPEQEKWLNDRTEFMIPFWHCQWKFRSTEACEDFLRYLREISADS
ncbi:MAG: hypothetical protein JXA64_02230 [Candidatus Fermentibacteraceae bacterium]|nr:hypothetical protein [Candidatus Fermentibacteraceae bacterium]